MRIRRGADATLRDFAAGMRRFVYVWVHQILIVQSVSRVRWCHWRIRLLQVVAQRHQQEQAGSEPLLAVNDQPLLQHCISRPAAHPNHRAKKVDCTVGALRHSEDVFDESLALVAALTVVALEDRDDKLVLAGQQR